jgi:AcrR family transcriptional regulator
MYSVYMTNDRRRTDTRKQIGRAAIGLFEQGGVRAVSMRKVAAEVGVTPMAIYNHFENMEDLLLFIYENGVHKLARSIRLAVDKQEGAGDRLKALVKSYVRFGFRNPHYYNLLFGTEFIQKYLWDQPPRSLVMVGFWSRLTEAVEDCQREGLIPPDRNTQEVATHLWSSMHGYALFLIIGRLQQLWQLSESAILDMMTRNLLGFMR